MNDASLTKCAALILAEIETHNEEILQGEPAWHKDEKKMCEAAYAGVDHESAQAEKRRAALDAHSMRSAKWNAWRQGRAN